LSPTQRMACSAADSTQDRGLSWGGSSPSSQLPEVVEDAFEGVVASESDVGEDWEKVVKEAGDLFRRRDHLASSSVVWGGLADPLSRDE